MNILENISITDAGAEGKAIARLENKVLFVENAVGKEIRVLNQCAPQKIGMNVKICK